MTTSPTTTAHQGLAAFTEALAARLPGRWTPSTTTLTTSAARNAVHDRLWDLAHASWALQTFVYERGGLLRGPGGRELFVLPRPHPHTGQYIAAPLLPEVLGSAYDHQALAPHGIAVGADPARAAAAVTDRLLPRYEQALRRMLEHLDPDADLPATTQDTDPPVLRGAVRSLLLLAELRVGDGTADLAETLAGLCDHLRLDYDKAALYEAAAVQTLLAAAGIDSPSLLDPAVPDYLRRLSALPLADKRDLLRRAVASLDDLPDTRARAARTRTWIVSSTPPAAAAAQAPLPATAPCAPAPDR
ncbi:hypothetical protein ACFVUH_08285 [Kitasatospora sp. NPDC058032]|uniref:hypothetical protein n=1 Tax=Kitasatospora sp. NPDC058032 TaxID=3346307 RepID=UPI0036DE28BD